MRHILLLLSALLFVSCATTPPEEACEVNFEGTVLTGNECRDFDSFAYAWDLIAKEAITATAEGVYRHRMLVAVTTLAEMKYPIDPARLGPLIQMAHEECSFMTCDDKIGNFVKRTYLQQVSALTDQERSRVTKSAIQKMVGVLKDDPYAAYVDCPEVQGTCYNPPKPGDDPVLTISDLGYGIFYVEIPYIYEETPQDLDAVIKEYDRVHGLQGLVLDMRNSPGGYVNSSIDVSDKFLANEDLLYLLRSLNRLHVYKSDGNDITNGAPIAILINGGSGSGTELITLSLASNKRAVSFGANSYGKNREVLETLLANGDLLYLTTGTYWSKDFRTVADTGIVPDHYVDQSDESTCNIPPAGEVDATICAAHKYLMEQISK